MTTTLQRLLKYPHRAVFDKDPVAELVLRVRHASGCVWRIAGGVMTVTTGQGTHTYDLTALTVAQLRAAMVADGLSVQNVTAKFDSHSALVLVEGGGDSSDQFDGVYPIPGNQLVSNGDHVYAYTSLLWALMSVYSREVDAAAEQVRQALLQMVIATAEGEWLSLWGTLYGVPRLDGETDAQLRLRIPREAFRLRVNPRAIELSVKDLTGKTITILEPWHDVFTLDQSPLSGGDKIQDGELVGPFLIQPSSVGSIDWSDVLPIIERNRPAGVLTLPPQVLYRGGAELGDAIPVGTSKRRRHVASPRYEDMALLDYAAIEETSVPNYPFLHRRTITHIGYAEIPPPAWQPFPWQPIPWSELPPYHVATKNYRSYRVYKLGVEYVSQTWPQRVWSDMAWAEINVVIGTAHSRTS